MERSNLSISLGCKLVHCVLVFLLQNTILNLLLSLLVDYKVILTQKYEQAVKNDS